MKKLLFILAVMFVGTFAKGQTITFKNTLSIPIIVHGIYYDPNNSCTYVAPPAYPWVEILIDCGSTYYLDMATYNSLYATGVPSGGQFFGLDFSDSYSKNGSCGAGVDLRWVENPNCFYGNSINSFTISSGALCDIPCVVSGQYLLPTMVGTTVTAQWTNTGINDATVVFY